MINKFSKKPAVHNAAKKKIYLQLEEKAKQMRNNPTKAEVLLWDSLKMKKLGVKFRRQHVIHQFIVDFYCIEKSLVIEVDGDIHDYQKDRDEQRTYLLEKLGCKILRFRNEEILNDLKKVIKIIKEAL
ncbi:MAG: endonuclease domain-containing protein [Patescibacteria group bacterium]|jgi:leucyl-tRNA synthetase